MMLYMYEKRNNLKIKKITVEPIKLKEHIIGCNQLFSDILGGTNYFVLRINQ